MKRWPTLLDFREMHIQVTVRYNYKSIKLAKIKKTDHTTFIENMGKQAIWYTDGENVKWYNLSGKQFSSFLKAKHPKKKKKKAKHPPNDSSICVCIYLYPRKWQHKDMKDMHTNIQSRFIYASQKLETTQISNNRWMYKQILSLVYNWSKFWCFHMFPYNIQLIFQFIYYQQLKRKNYAYT